MKCVSASIVVLAGVGSLTATGFIQHDDTQLFIGFVAVVVTGLGLVTWGWLIKDEITTGWRDELNDIQSDYRNEIQALSSSLQNQTDKELSR